jgi:DNA-binding MarR family transcriptional regulator
MAEPEQLYDAFYEAYLLLDDNQRRFFRPYELSSARYHALLRIQQVPGVSLSELSKYLLCTKGNTTRIVRALEEKGYLTRQVDQTDSRALCLHVTETGEALLQQVTAAYHEFKSSGFGRLPLTDREALRQGLSALSGNLRNMLRS